MRLKQMKQEVTVAPDGRTVVATTMEIQVLNAGAARSAEIPIRYDASISDAEITDAYTLKSDGRKLAVDPANILTQRAPQTNPLIPIYADSQQKIVIFPNVEAGDSLVLSAKSSEKTTLLPGQFSLTRTLLRTIEAGNADFSVAVPKTMHVNVASNEVTASIAAQGDSIVYHWTFSNSVAKPQPASIVVDPDKGAFFSISTFKDYDALSHSLAAVIVPKVAVTPEIQKQADTITAGIKDRKEQTRAIYEWVSGHVRYVGLEFGTGAYVPHDPNWTLSNAFGDCKDQAVLFASLLKAKGIPAELVLIHAGNHYALAQVPTAGQFNHMIAWLPEERLYADTTVAHVPFGMLPVADYGKPVVHLVTSGAARHQTPVLPDGIISTTYKVHAVEQKDGQFDVRVTSQATGPWAATLHGIAEGMQAAGSTAYVDRLLKAHNVPNSSGTLDVADAGTPGLFGLNGGFHTAKWGAASNLVLLPAAMQIFPRAGDGLVGPMGNTTITAEDETPCYSGRQSEEIVYEFTGGHRLAKAPPDSHVKSEHLTYDATWTLTEHGAVLHREFVTHISEATCTGALRQEAAQALEKIRADYARQVTLLEG